METQRRNRQLLFGKAENTRNNNSGSSDRNQAEQLFEQENNQAWEQLHGKVGSLKDVSGPCLWLGNTHRKNNQDCTSNR
jgi:hypothetical protein